jgi:hypothetical protein
MENALVARAGYPMATVSMTGVRSKGALAWLLLPMKLLVASGRRPGSSSGCVPTLCSPWEGTWRFPAA